MSFLGGYSWRQLLSCRLTLWLTNDDGGWGGGGGTTSLAGRHMNASLGLSFPDGVGSITEGSTSADRQPDAFSSQCAMVWRRRQGLESTSPHLTSGPCVLLVCDSTSLPTSSSMAGPPPAPVELCSHSAAVEGSGNHSAGCTLFAQTPVIAPLSRVCLLWVMAECVMLESTTFSCRTQKVLIFSLFFQEMVLFYSVFHSVSLTTADNTQTSLLCLFWTHF